MRPQNKVTLIEICQQRYQDIMTFITEVPEKLRYKTFKTKERDKSIRDVIYHLHGWHLLLIEWQLIHNEGGKPVLPKYGHTWDRLDILNQEIWENGKTYTLDHVLELFKATHQEIIDMILSMSEEELYQSGQFIWAGKAPIAHLIDAIMAHHYEWGLDTLKKLFQE